MLKLLILPLTYLLCYADSVDGRTDLHNFVYYEKYEDVALILKKSTDVDVKNAAGLTPLHIAIKIRDLKMATMLLDGGADVNAKDNHGNTPLKKKNMELVRFLVLRGADVNLANDEGISPLHQASYSANAPIVEFLLDTGADNTAKSNVGYTAFDFAVAKNNLSIIDVLKVYEKGRE